MSALQLCYSTYFSWVKKRLRKYFSAAFCFKKRMATDHRGSDHLLLVKL